MDTEDSDFGPTAAKRMRVAEISIEEVKAEIVVETEQHAKVVVAEVGTPEESTPSPTSDLLMEQDGISVTAEGNVTAEPTSKKKKKKKKESESGMEVNVNLS